MPERNDISFGTPRSPIEARAMTQNFRRATMQRSHTWIAGVLLAGVTTLMGCVVYEPVPAPAPSTFERSWSAALGAAQEEGVQISFEDRINGVIKGYRGEQELTINIRTEAGGNVRVEMSARGPKGSDPGLAGRISRAYDRRMGR
jgi:hypothetical protein